jgi:viroplasmin and RNaseH domain-containing protein
LLLAIPNPLVTKKKNPPKLFFTVDYAASGADKENEVVYLTAYHDRKDLAAKVVDILLAFMNTTTDERWQRNGVTQTHSE